MSPSYSPPRVGSKSFSLLNNAFLQSDDLPFRDVLTEEEIHEAFVAEKGTEKGTSLISAGRKTGQV
jgi:hypothetical protein